MDREEPHEVLPGDGPAQEIPLFRRLVLADGQHSVESWPVGTKGLPDQAEREGQAFGETRSLAGREGHRLAHPDAFDDQGTCVPKLEKEEH